MEKMKLTLEVDTAAKEQAEEILGLPISDAFDLFLEQVIHAESTGRGFSYLTSAMVPPEMDADRMTKEEIIADIEEGLEESRAGKGVNAEEALTNFLESRRRQMRNEAV